MSAVLDLPRHRFRRDQYERMVEAGVFGPEDRLELLDGEIFDMAPQKSRHATAVTLVGEALRAALGPGVTVRTQLPLALDEHSEPEPDLAVVPGAPRDYRDAHPAGAILVCEVADSSQAYDRGRKLLAYARAGIPEYWILDLAAGTLEVCRDPRADGFRERQIHGPDTRVATLHAPGAPLRVSDLLP